MDESSPLRILQVSTADVGGGAERIAWNLHRSYEAAGQTSWLAVGNIATQGAGILQIPNEALRNPWARWWRAFAARLQPLAGRLRGTGRAQGFLQGIAEPRRWLDHEMGHEDVSFPGSWRVLELTNERPTVLHCHNLHGGYFDLRALPTLSTQVPTILTLHDAWLLSGHCAHSFTCGRWESGCGECPDLTIYPSVRRDATARNWKVKRRIYAQSRLYLATPSQWLMSRVVKSMLDSAIIGTKVIHNGVDLSQFHPAKRDVARSRLDIPQDAAVLLFTANGIRANVWKDYSLLRSVLSEVSYRMEKEPVVIALGESSPPERIGRAELRFVPYERDPSVVAAYYQAADIYLHPARVDTFPNTVLEALASGTPVVATAVGGIPEQIRDGQTGFLTQPGDVRAMTDAVVALLDNDGLRTSMAGQAAKDAIERFDLRRQANEYLSWYQEIQSSWRPGPSHSKGPR